MNNHSQEYEAYIHSPEWNIIKQKRKEIDGNKCIMCRRPESTCKKKGLQCHHITYDRLGHEDVYKDLVTLCSSCHIKMHNFLKRRTKPE